MDFFFLTFQLIDAAQDKLFKENGINNEIFFSL